MIADQPGHRARGHAEHATASLASTHSANSQASAAAAVATWVASIAMPARPLAPTAEPALKPNQPTQSSAGADHRVGQVVRGHVVVPVAHALAEHQRADQAGDAGVDVHHRAAGEVEPRPGASSQPPPQTQWAIGRVDQQRPQRR